MRLSQRIKRCCKPIIKSVLVQITAICQKALNRIHTDEPSPALVYAPVCNANFALLRSTLVDISAKSGCNIEYYLTKDTTCCFCNRRITKSGRGGSKNILFITHELSLTGAPIVIFDAVKAVLGEGYRAVLASPFDGPLREEYQKLDVPVIIDKRLAWGRFDDVDTDLDLVWGDNKFFKQIDCIFMSTFLCHSLLATLTKTNIPIFWWLHEGSYTYDYAKTVGDKVSKTVPSNVHVYSGGDTLVKRYKNTGISTTTRFYYTA